MAGYINKKVVQEMQRWISVAQYIAIIMDEVTNVDNKSFLFVHVYIVKHWMRVLLLVAL